MKALLLALLCTATASAAELTVCAEPWDPFISNQAGKPTGLAVDVLNTAAQASGYTLRYQFLSAGGCTKLMHASKTDIIAFPDSEPSWPGWLYTQKPLVFWVLHAWVRKDSPLKQFRSLEDFYGQNVAWVADYEPDYPRRLKAVSSWKRMPAPDTTASLSMLVGGRVDVVFDDAAAHSMLAPGMAMRIRRLDPQLASRAQPFALRRGLESLRNAIDAESTRQASSGRLDDFYKRELKIGWKQVLQLQ